MYKATLALCLFKCGKMSGENGIYYFCDKKVNFLLENYFVYICFSVKDVY